VIFFDQVKFGMHLLTFNLNKKEFARFVKRAKGLKH